MTNKRKSTFFPENHPDQAKAIKRALFTCAAIRDILRQFAKPLGDLSAAWRFFYSARSF